MMEDATSLFSGPEGYRSSSKLARVLELLPRYPNGRSASIGLYSMSKGSRVYASGEVSYVERDDREGCSLGISDPVNERRKVMGRRFVE